MPSGLAYTQILDFEIHPGLGLHVASYIRIRRPKGTVIKIYNSLLPEVYEPRGQTARMIDVKIAP